MIFLNPQYFRSKIRANKKVASSELKSRGRIYSVFEIREHTENGNMVKQQTNTGRIQL